MQFRLVACVVFTISTKCLWKGNALLLVALLLLNRKKKLQIYLCLVCISTSLPVSPHSGIFDQHLIYVNYNRQESVKFDLLAR